MKVLIVSDTPRDGWAIGKICDAIIRHNPQCEIRFIAVHPKEVYKYLDEFKEKIKDIDLIHYHYWNSTKQLFEFMPELKDIPSIHHHHNQKNTLELDWRAMNIRRHMVATSTNKKKLTDAGYSNVEIVNFGIDLNYFKYNENYNDQEYVGYVGRVVPWKGLKEIAWAARMNDMRVLIMGRMDKPSYFEEIPIEDKAVIDWLYNNVPDGERINAFYDMMMYVGFSSDGREEGTQGLLEAMASGVPVITTPAGVAIDIIDDGENGLICPFDNREALRVKIKMMKEDKALRERLRKNAWNTIKNFHEEKMARECYKIYVNEIFGKDSVSVITPIYNCSHLDKIYEALKAQTYPIAEWIVVDDNSDGEFNWEDKIAEWRLESGFAIKYLNTKKDGYNLAMARNMGIIEAVGKWIMFLDDRMCPEPEAVEQFMVMAKEKKWLFGNKGGGKKNFIENFSFVNRKELIHAGMFCERIDKYGGMSQEIRERWTSQGNTTEYNDFAVATQLKSSKMDNKRRADIIEMKLKLYKMGL